MFRKILELFFTFLGFLLFSIVAFIGFDNSNKKLIEYESNESKVIEKGVVNSERESKIFFFKILNSNENFRVYRFTKKYSDLENKIKIGETIKVYYSPSKIKNEKYNIDVIQIEKKDEIILNQSENKLKYVIIMVVGILASIYMIYIAFCLIKYGKFVNPIPPLF